MSEVYAAIHTPASKAALRSDEYIDEGLAKWGRPELAVALQNKGVDPLFSRGSEAYDSQTGVAQVLRPRITRSLADDGYQVAVTPVEVACSQVAVIRNVAKVLQQGLPELNQPDVRTTARDKVAANTMLATVGLAKEFVGWSAGADIDEALDHFTGDAIIVKPRQGMRSRDIRIGTKKTVYDWVSDGQLDAADWIFEERLDLSLPLPLKGLTERDDDLIKLVNEQRLPKELRAFTFGRPNGADLAISFVMRAAKPDTTCLTNDDWVYIDPASVPVEAVAQTDAVMKAYTAYTGVQEIHAAIDWVLARSAARPEPSLLPMELNASEPQLVYEHQQLSVARTQTSMLADQMIRIMERGEL